jgi:SsrA-binding protein
MSVLASNKKALYDYDIIDTYEAGIKLLGFEVKSVRAKQMSLKGSFISCLEDTCVLRSSNISRYKFATMEDYDPMRPRTLLLHRKEIDKIQSKSGQPGFAVVPLEVYTKGKHLKLKLAVVKGKKKYQKKESIKRKDLDRDMQRQMKKWQ